MTARRRAQVSFVIDGQLLCSEVHLQRSFSERVSSAPPLWPSTLFQWLEQAWLRRNADTGCLFFRGWH